MKLLSSSISAKIFASFATVLLVVVALGFVSVNRLAVVNDDAVDIRTNWLVATRTLGDYQFHTMRFRQIEAAAILADTPDKAAKEEASLKAVAGDAQKAWNSYELTVTTGEERALVDKVKSGWQAYLVLDAKMIEMITSGDKKAAYGNYVGDMRGAYNTWHDTLVKDVDLQVKGADKAGNEGAEANRSGQIWIYSSLGFAAFLCVFIGLLLTRNVSAPVKRMTGVMGRLAAHDLSSQVIGIERRDEIGAMAKAVQVFKDNMIKGDEMAAAQQAEQIAKEDRTKKVNSLTAAFDARIGTVVESVSSQAKQMESSAQSLSATAEEATKQSAAVAAASEEASANVQTVASAAEELSSSIAEISRQVSQSSKIAANAVSDAEKANQMVQGLVQASQKIGDVVALITDIANQTNLLALNATIEAARAGEAGKGFAVVAAEVKNLATQTAKATEEIGVQITGVQGATQSAVHAIQTIGKTIGEINGITSSIAAAVEEQSAATKEIARNVEQASSGTQEVASNISGVSQSANDTGTAAGQVLAAARELSGQSESLKSVVTKFLVDVQAA